MKLLKFLFFVLIIVAILALLVKYPFARNLSAELFKANVITSQSENSTQKAALPTKSPYKPTIFKNNTEFDSVEKRAENIPDPSFLN